MKKFLLISVLLFSFYSNSFCILKSDDLIDKNLKYVVKVISEIDGTIYREGFGIYLNNYGAVLTLYNNIVGFKDVKFVNYKGDTLYAKSIIGLDKTADLVLINVGVFSQDKIDLDLSPKIKINDKISIIGVNTNKIDTIYSGIVTENYVNNDGISLYTYMGKIIPGIEGGLVFNEKNKLIGLTKGLYRNNYFSGYILPLNYAKDLLEKSNKVNISLTDSSVFSIYNIYYWRGIYAAEKGVNDYLEAINHFKVALKAKPNDINTYFQLGLVFGLSGMFDSSAHYYKESIKMDPKFFYAYLNLAVTYMMNQDFASATPVLKEAVKINSLNERANFYLAFALMKNGEYSESIKYYKKALELKPNNPEVMEYLAEAYYLTKKYRDAVKFANNALKINPQSANALYVIGLVHFELGEKTEAEKIQKELELIDKIKANLLLNKINGEKN
jgi:Flp pilus assembly protein TadD